MSDSITGGPPLESGGFSLDPVPGKHYVEVEGRHVVPKLGLSGHGEYTRAQMFELEYEAAWRFAIEAETPEGVARLERLSRQIDEQCAREDRRRQRAEKLRLALLEMEEEGFDSPLRLIERLIEVGGGLDSLHNEACAIASHPENGPVARLVGLGMLFNAEWARANAAWFEAHARQHAVRRVLEYSEFGRWPVEIVRRPDGNLYIVDDNWPDEPEPAPVRRIGPPQYPAASAGAGQRVRTEDAGQLTYDWGRFYRRLEWAVEAVKRNPSLLEKKWDELGAEVAEREADSQAAAGVVPKGCDGGSIARDLREGMKQLKGWDRMPPQYHGPSGLWPLLVEASDARKAARKNGSSGNS